MKNRFENKPEAKTDDTDNRHIAEKGEKYVLYCHSCGKPVNMLNGYSRCTLCHVVFCHTCTGQNKHVQHVEDAHVFL